VIHVDKPQLSFPSSLNSKITNRRRAELIKNEAFINQEIYESRYTQKDIKENLRSVYHKKCAFCEQKQEIMTVEHYRPKSIYYWLSYSWDNLLWCCQKCNSYKNKNFEIEGELAEFTSDFFNNIHTIGTSYQDIEQPKLINPEIELNPEKHFYFNEDGEIFSNSEIGKYTIKICRLDRKHLNEERQKILDELKELLTEHRISNDFIGIEKVKVKFESTINQYDKYEFIAFRKYILDHWFNNIYSEIINM